MSASPETGLDPRCDWCGESVQVDLNGWWIGVDQTSDCPENGLGHAVNGKTFDV